MNHSTTTPTGPGDAGQPLPAVGDVILALFAQNNLCAPIYLAATGQRGAIPDADCTRYVVVRSYDRHRGFLVTREDGNGLQILMSPSTRGTYWRPTGPGATGPVVSGPTAAVRDRFTVFAGPDGWAWAEGWTEQGHSVLATGCRWVTDAVPALQQANPGAVITTAAPAEDAEVLALAATGGHFAVDGDPACAQCARLSRPAGDGQDGGEQDGGEVEWCRLCGEQPAQLAAGDGLCGFCRGDVAEGRVIDPDAGSVTDTVLLGVSGLGIVFGAVGVLVGAWHLDAVTVTTALATVGAFGWLLARMHGICRACGHRGSAGDPLTVLRRPRVHTRHLPNIRESHRLSRQGAAAAAAAGAETPRPPSTPSAGPTDTAPVPRLYGPALDGERCEACGAGPAHRVPIKPEHAVVRTHLLLCGPCLQGVLAHRTTLDEAAGGAR
jgi:hypothetical protein